MILAKHGGCGAARFGNRLRRFTFSDDFRVFYYIAMGEERKSALIFWALFGAVELLWLLASMGGTWFVARAVYSRDQRSRLALASQILRADLVAFPPHSDSFGSYLAWAQRVLPLVNRYGGQFAGIGYVLVWNSNGDVAFLAVRVGNAFDLVSPLVDHVLSPQAWAAPGSTGSSPFRRIHRLPWVQSGNFIDFTTYFNASPTSRSRTAKRFHGYISMGLSESWLASRFVTAARHPLEISLLIALGGMAALGFLFFLVMRRFEYARQQYAQTLRARTSLLSERGMLASVLAHEVRSPLTALRFNLHFLRSLVEAPIVERERQIEMTHACEREVRRLDLMLDDFLQRTQIITDARDASLNTVVAEALDFLHSAMESQSIRVITHLQPGDVQVSIGADELRQVLLNLCANAQEAMPRGGTLAVSTVAETDSALLLVRDSGVGIDPTVQSRVFEPFFTTKPRGSGLGLALVRRVISGAGGTILFESEPGKGTTFRIVLPRSVASPQRQEFPVAKAESVIGQDTQPDTFTRSNSAADPPQVE